ncbi:5-dehydro-2-deoxygluconokinase [Paenibacillus alginolyticus]|uniref:5-dehydro-2-deoxygluconokinase n=1 Tax=Paenibacillus alginolyticus TaxID=59839 RepID=A0ABT4GLX1_9BACL|nr:MULTISPECIES: 5-dehydro-2-deoxygluconokinase [Paenibacillus]MCY9665014.1 5-dehydro-2-deoxygluconokinase [Paenibacillus alginolyticus]MCY9697216.1 5-dehydro-2-deoxygluconokinase [Paenibacillus alginolyticus]MEC0143674.1 5-dehydro-2-deoxygluconokinase [Paenibacillus alginolyticus]NRF92627.1 5-dehydro-2-deoxygluconokinase [Paenibacillus frigoriresistens]
MTYVSFPQSKPLDFVAIGRLCIDLNANEINRPMEETMTFTKYVGGSPANITIGMARLGMKTAFIGKIANDQMGRFIADYLERNNIETTNVVTDHTGAVTGLAFTEIKSPAECSILMYRDNVADLLLTPAEVQESLIAEAKVLLISGTALAQSPSREAVFQALEYAKKHGAVIIFDLDYRPYTWKTSEETAVYYNLAAEKCDIILGTREEFDMMERFENNPEKNDRITAAKWFDYSAKIVIIKHGKEGSIAYTQDGVGHRAKSFPAKVVKTFGAGDSYAAGFIYGIMQGWTIEKSMEYGSAAACIVISSHSCSDAMPTTDQVNDYIERCNRGEITAS